MRIKFYTLLFLMAGIMAFAQTVISGIVRNSAGDLVSNASVTVEESGSDAILGYAITNSKGAYKLSFSSGMPTVDLKVKAFNHKSTFKQISNRNQDLDFNLETEATEIKEVQLKTKIITKKGDTITYDLKSFETKNDRVLADVLKKMPGIEVNKDGSIFYQGQPLAKFYVNGKDLMEGGYGVINNSLPKDAVSKVEVLENHQPVKILQDKVSSDQAAINIKLKSKVTMTGRGEAGSGFADPWLWNLKLTPMFFGQKNQWVVNYKTNNMGETVEQEGTIFGMGNRWEGRRSNASQNIWSGVETAATPNLPEKRYLMNNIHFVTANILTNPFKNKEWELKVGGNYTNNVVERESYSETFDKQLNITRNTRILNDFYTNKAKGEITVTKNAKQGFFKNLTTFNQFWNGDRAVVDMRSSVNRFANQGIQSPSTSFQNSLSTIVPIKSKMLNIMSYISYQDDKQTLDVRPGSYVYYPTFSPGPLPTNLFSGANLLSQYINNKSLEINHSATIGFSKKFWTFTPEIGYNFSSAKLNSNITGQTSAGFVDYGRDFSNDVKFTKSTPYAGLGINYKSENWTVLIQNPVNFNIIKAEDPIRTVNKDFKKTTFEPSGFVQYSFASFWKAQVFGNINNSFANISDTYAGIIISNPSSLSAMDPNNPIMETLSKRVGPRIEYRNPLNNLFFNASYTYTDTKRNLLASYFINPAGFAVVQYQPYENSIRANAQSAEIGKYFPKFKSNLSFSFRNSSSQSENLRNNDLYLNKNYIQSFGGKFNNNYFSWINLDYSFSLGWGQNKNPFFESSNQNFTQNLLATVFPVENHSIALNWDQINFKQEGTSYKNGFYDLIYQYAWAAKKIDFELKWLNIANKKVFEKISDTAAETTYQKIQIRPSQLMMTVKFNFK